MAAGGAFGSRNPGMARFPRASNFNVGMEQPPPRADIGNAGGPGPAATPAGSGPAAAALPTNTTMQGKTCVITGATSGIGLAAAEALAQMGAELVLVGRNREKGEATLKHLREIAPDTEVHMHYADLSLLADVRRVAQEILASTPRIDVLINNAGAVFDRCDVTAEGLEQGFATNYLSHFLLTSLLHDRLVASAPARVITLSSVAHRMASLDMNDVMTERIFHDCEAGGLASYVRAKLCNILFTVELADQLSGTGVAAVAVCPGATATGFWGKHHKSGPNNFMSRFKHRAATPQEAGQGMAYIASTPEVAEANGAYIEHWHLVSASPAALDKAMAKQLWAKSVEICGLPH